MDWKWLGGFKRRPSCLVFIDHFLNTRTAANYGCSRSPRGETQAAREIKYYQAIIIFITASSSLPPPSGFGLTTSSSSRSLLDLISCMWGLRLCFHIRRRNILNVEESLSRTFWLQHSCRNTRITFKIFSLVVNTVSQWISVSLCLFATKWIIFYLFSLLTHFISCRPFLSSRFLSFIVSSHLLLLLHSSASFFVSHTQCVSFCHVSYFRLCAR